MFAIGCTSATPTPNLSSDSCARRHPDPDTRAGNADRCRAQTVALRSAHRRTNCDGNAQRLAVTQRGADAHDPADAARLVLAHRALSRPTPARPQQLGPQLQAVLDAQRETVGIPGIAASIAFPDGSIWSSGSGDASIATQEPASGRHAVRRRLDQQDIRGGDDHAARRRGQAVDRRPAREVDARLPGRPEHHDPAAAPSHERDLRLLRRAELRRTRLRLADRPCLDARRRSCRPLPHAPYFPPGTDYHYSNTNFILLGMVVEQITGQQLGDVYRQRFFAPLGMADTYFQGSGPPPATAAAGYLLRARGLREQTDGSDYRPTVSGGHRRVGGRRDRRQRTRPDRVGRRPVRRPPGPARGSRPDGGLDLLPRDRRDLWPGHAQAGHRG